MAKTKKKNKWTKILLWGCSFIVIVAIGLWIFLNSMTYSPSSQAELAFQNNNQVTVTAVKDGYKYEPQNGTVIEPNIIFYPGGLVEPESYSLFARELAKLGHRVYIAEMPLNLAIFGQNKADSFINEHPDESFVIGGHSLGGSFAARYASEHSEKLKGVYFLASYADKTGSIKDTDLSVLQITGTADGVLNREDWETAKNNLPADTLYVSIDGANHGQFGSYGKQKGDNNPDIDDEEQLQKVVQSIEDWIAQMNSK
ncbi:MAG: alpha/beta hydrolase [Candidatus Pristimantibacillus lignocellulolyticus]|uniref:Alpha/beta hydrolase n=1 Tax=Candidatus Pristimantibacillus lignocellulolyticus TaxID=2994561 RepID=A0A9J6ZCN1_9BACL|nr:MAG: alpha/beta hydrolase [Candidatus Pristimantibacillus lignocellulolyticus]